MTRNTFFWLIGLMLAAIFACGTGLGMGSMIAGRSAARALPTLAPVTPTPWPTQTPTPAPTPAPAAAASGSTSDLEQEFIAIYNAASPSVVNITTQILRPDFFWGTVPEEGSGSGFVWDDQGHIVTNYHVIEDAHTIEVSFAPDVVLPATVVGADPANDLAVIRVDNPPAEVHPLPLADSDALEVGQIVVAIGNPFGRFQRTMTTGIISALDRTIRVGEGRVLRRVIQTDADINRGNSGGPLLDSSGRVIGVISAIYSPTGTNAGVGLAIPINKARRVAPVLIEKGRFAHPWLGIEHLGYEITPYLAQSLGLPVDQGLLVARIYENSPAWQAGIRPANEEIILGNYRYLVGGDIITAIDGIPLKSWEDLDAYLQENTEVGQTVTLDVVRDGQSIQVEVELGEQP
jgi:S1-C subfamily serine protease